MHVVEAYRRPTVERSHPELQWRSPDFEGLRRFCISRFEWTKASAANRRILQEEADAQLGPLERELSQPLVQTSIASHLLTYERNAKVGAVRSQRLQVAISSLSGRPDVSDIAVEPPCKRRSSANAPNSKRERQELDELLDGVDWT